MVSAVKYPAHLSNWLSYVYLEPRVSHTVSHWIVLAEILSQCDSFLFTNIDVVSLTDYLTSQCYCLQAAYSKCHHENNRCIERGIRRICVSQMGNWKTSVSLTSRMCYKISWIWKWRMHHKNPDVIKNDTCVKLNWKFYAIVYEYI